MPTLHWIGKDKVINHHMDVPFKVLEHSYGFDNGTQTEQATNSGNKIIHGDNLEALKALLPEYEGRIKCIYIDPPYNTGNEGWVYNDNVNDPKIKKWLGQVVGKEAEDLTRHDKWLCMMYPRLKLLHKLLADDGAIFISIDDNEQANLKLMCDEIFGIGNFLGNILWKKKTNGNNMGHIPPVHDFFVCYAKNQLKLSLPGVLLSQEYLQSNFSNPDNDPRGPWKTSDLSANHKGPYFPIVNPKTKEEHYPPKGRYWVFNEEEVRRRIEKGTIIFGKTGNTKPVQKVFLENKSGRKKPETWWDKHGLNSDGMKELSEILGTKMFDHPKPSVTIKHIISISTQKEDIILDSFAGSGTTAHAVLNLNKQDGGNRKFILIEMENYAETITAERVKRVIKGYGTTEGTGGSFDFYELGQPLFLEDGNLNELVGVEKIRQYVYYTETNTPLSETKHKDNKHFLGKHNDTAYYFNYEQDEVTTLDHAFLATMKTKAEQYVIYADNCLLTKDFMTKHKIIFKKIPRDITRF
jgi:adenine-specific DNA-methyltransferase